uniref:Polymerase nucleotidyl transferase domain-containing protein n=1 Tax=Candidatus Methanogaster sp. ANME-2c ERB4 TaxID=2759911 RepID=A0A7G9Y2J9_9EURY|nr:hypothetical protein MKPHGJHB_00011 [Methanosarcinales archaeon ANME-2c ERB4]QNO43303.1 hypothetical protein BKKEKDFB_00015 [Methanosarcinales archaeon ANME-2c ERB4]QNO45373.1 hypothetical protein CHNKENMJ_00004 [Methanosarcinales archaeon ANME-2c ERB4]QNO45640.1 hypothetical protein JMABOEBK_00037 [Methanosarcinales archaeon ANME-2c ERB4]
MVKSRVISAIKFLQQCLKETGLEVSKIILFGSQSREEATEESDIDILIISEDFWNKDIFERAKLTKDAEIILLCHITDKSTAGGGMTSNRLENKTNVKRLNGWLI